MDRLEKLDRWLPLLVFLGTALLYLPTLSPSVVAGDGGELQMLARTLGVSHPTGYPLFILMSWLFTLLPLGDVAYRVTLLCALITAGTVTLLYLLVREVGGGRGAALLAALLMAAAPRVWMHAAATEVYALSNFFILLGLWLLLRWGDGKIPLWLLTLGLGFGLTHHISMRLLGPSVAFYLLAVQPRLLYQFRQWLPALVTLLLPLLLYLYIPLRAAHFESMPQWQGMILSVRKLDASGLVTPHYQAGGAANVVLAMDYSSRFFELERIGPEVLNQYLTMTREQFPLLVLPVALLGLLYLLRTRWRVGLLLLLSYALTTFAALQFLARVGEDGDHFIPSYLLTALCFGVGVTLIVEWVRKLPQGQMLSYGAFAVLALLPLWSLNAHFRQAMAQRQLAQAPLARELLAPLPEGSVIVGEWSYITPLRYMQHVESLRQDLWVIHAGIDGMGPLMWEAFAAQTPFYVLRPAEGGARLLPIPVTEESIIEHPTEKRLGEGIIWRGYGVSMTAPTPATTLQITLFWEVEAAPAQEWKTFIHLVDAAGQGVAQVDRVPLTSFYPPTAWQAGQLLADQYEISLPEKLAPGSYRLVFGWYNEAGRLLWEDGQDHQVMAGLTVDESGAISVAAPD